MSNPKTPIRKVAQALIAISLVGVAAVGCKKNRPIPPPPTVIRAPETQTPEPLVTDPNAAAPELDVRIEPAAVLPGDSALLSWEARETERVTIDHNIGPVSTSGRIKLFPDATTTYQVTAEGRGGVVERKVTVEVRASPLGGSEGTVDSEDLTQSLAERFSALVKPVFFDFDSATLTDEAKISLQGNIRWLNRDDNRELRFVIEGHCDIRGSEEYNFALGDKRSRVVHQYLVEQGVAAGRIVSISLGEERPFSTGDREDDHALNRRAHFVLLNDEERD